MNERILVVDDTPANIQTVAAILKGQGYQLSVATNGKQALEVLEKIQPDLILLDVMAHKTLEYRDGAVNLKGFLADEGRSGARPGVVLFPEAFGIGDHVIERARRLAAVGYVALAADPYGDAKQAKDLPDAIELMTYEV